MGIAHVLLNVADREASARGYESRSVRSRCAITIAPGFRVGRSHVGLLKAPEGACGLNHFCVPAEPFNYDAVVARLSARPLRSVRR
jgi:catechol 2,3-dioxygenase-like lactoylglutathione lyase family enzyme